ncbi:ParB/RepB/Spo0J family partition protein [Gemmiger sp. An194]|uniref:ParB/RepB/Spo0J family partition protein n=1 Tax=Gemmiger sp. An194 TaxID=1965582 RepID=UPI000B376981|nr:ParB/RepB/Spo0J family partition protein [Gemmiger sp. An194]OUP23487.1 chromosome partitioning protein ParB [Gemmiger sp. An194]
MYGQNIRLPSLDNLFSSESDRQDAKLEKVQNLRLSELFSFKDHPFQIRDDEEMQKMVDSIKDHGVLTPAIVRPRPEGGYELVSGHRRHRGCTLAGLDTMPCIVREMDDDTAVILMVDSNCQREHILPSEKAKAYKMMLEALQRKRGRPALENSGQVGPNFKGVRSNQLLADDVGESVKQIQRYIRLTDLIPDLLDMVDEGQLKLTPAVELSSLAPHEQEEVLEYLQYMECTPSLSQAQKLKTASKNAPLTPESIEKIMSAKTPSVSAREPQIRLSVSKIEQYFPKGYTIEQMEQYIIRLLENYERSRSREGR